MRYEGSVCVVTGASSGIGRALAIELVARGATVVVSGRRMEALEETRRRCGAPERCDPFVADVTDARAMVDLVEHTLAQHGPIDLFVNNAGVGIAGELDVMTAEDWDFTLGPNLHGVLHGIQAVLPGMRARGAGHIANVGSVAGLVPRPGMAAYAASKHAVTAITLSLRLELARDGVDVTLVAPGSIATEILDNTRYRGGIDGDAVKRLANGRLMTATRCATLIADGIARNRAIVVVTPMARAEWLLFRLSPRLSLRLARVRLWLMRTMLS